MTSPVPPNPTTLLQTFVNGTGRGAFPNLGVPRSIFSRQISDRLADPGKIAQADSSLCGPAVFMFWLARKKPALYAKYVVDLFEQGEAKIGTLAVKPGSDCRQFRPGTAIDAVDWVALASLRDSENSYLDYDDVSVAAGGVTLPHSVVRWFRAAGFEDVKNKTNLVVDKPLSTLVAASLESGAGKPVCLFVGGDVFAKPVGGYKLTADHWVGLTSSISVGGTMANTLAARAVSVDGDEKLLDADLKFTVFSWGSSSRPADLVRKPLKTRDFLDFFYGFVSAR